MMFEACWISEMHKEFQVVYCHDNVALMILLVPFHITTKKKKSQNFRLVFLGKLIKS